MKREKQAVFGEFLFFFGHVIEWTDETREAMEECCCISTGERKKPRSDVGMRVAGGGGQHG